MIHCLNKKKYPTRDQSIGESVHYDMNGLGWHISRVLNGFFVRFTGDEYFIEDTFICRVNGADIWIRNTNCLFINDQRFEAFDTFRQIIKNGYTDEIWETIAGIFEDRLNKSTELLPSEMADKSSMN